MTCIETITRLIARRAPEVYLSLSDGWHSHYYGAVITPLIGEFCGFTKDTKHLYIGPAAHDLTQLDPERARVHQVQSGATYAIEQAFVSQANGENHHVIAVLRAVKE